MICSKCGHRMNRIDDKEDGVIIRIRHKCGNVDCRHEEKIERTIYKSIKNELLNACIIQPSISENINFLIERL